MGSPSGATCGLGKRACEDGRYGACDVLEVVEHGARDAGSSAYSLLDLGASQPCTDNPCDPYCMSFSDNVSGLDAGAPLAVVDGGLTLAESAGPAAPYSGLLVTPASPTVTVTAIPQNAYPTTSPATVTFQAQYTPAQSPPAYATARWSLDDTTYDLIDASGNLSVLSAVPKNLTVTAKAGGLVGTTTASVVVDALEAPGVAQATIDAFAAAGAASATATTTLFSETFDDNHAGWTAGSSTLSAPASTSDTGTAVTVFADSFGAGNANGWMVGPSWAIGGTALSSCGSGPADPANDASGVPGGGVAGTVLGGCWPVPSFWSFLVSPVIDLSAYTSATLSFNRHLDCDDDLYRNCEVDVTPDGSHWYTLFKVRGSGKVHDDVWTPVSYDLSGYLTNAFQVRFGYVVAPGGDAQSGWNIDDVSVSGVVSWSIGAATASTGQTAGGPDPGVDHAGVAGGGIAGVVRGGNARGAVQVNGSSTWFETTGRQYLTSPVVDTSSATGTVALSFWRWLNTDGAPYMDDFLDVFDGTSWVNLWESGKSAVPWQPGQSQDAAWTPMSFDHDGAHSCLIA
jgi:hypothetical protein